MNEIKVIDDFLNEEDFKKLEKIFCPRIPWEFSDVISDERLMCDPKYNFQYVHTIFHKEKLLSNFYDYTVPFLNKIDARALVRVKINSVCRQEEIIVHGFHTDIEYKEYHPTGLDGMRTAILYLNTNNGFTFFENGTKVESVANRCVLFPAHYKHSGSTCTDVHRRLALNVVYF